MTARENRFLSRENAEMEGVAGRWSGGNDQWWDWYMSLAVNTQSLHAVVASPALPALSVPNLAEVERVLSEDVSVDDETRRLFETHGWVKLRQLCPPEAALGLRGAFIRAFDATDLPAMGFPSLEMMWTHEAWSRCFVRSRRFASVAGQLLDVESVRLYHDNALCKSPGCGRTPWHYDAHHYPIDSADVVTLWMPLQPTPAAMGPLVFSQDRDLHLRVRDADFDKFGTAYDAGIIELIEREGVAIELVEYDLGDVTFHHADALHSAGPNRTELDRYALATTYFADGARLVSEPTMISGDFEKFMPGVEPGHVIDSPLNPVLWRRGEV
ncbi:MAG: phytanoyl-CoA dioxygenase family protein [Myxococcota bacterium]